MSLKNATFVVLTRLVLGFFTACNFQPALATERGDTLESSFNKIDARALAAKVLDAYGGEAALKQIDETNYKDLGKVIQYSTISGAANTFDCEIFAKGEKTRVSMNFMGESIITGYNGQHGWIQQGDQVFKPHPLAEKTIKDEIEHGLLLVEKLVDPTTTLELLGKKTILGRPCDILKIKVPSDTPTLFYADEDSHRILQSEYEGVDAEQGVPATKIYTYEDYRPLDRSIEPYLVTEYCGSQLASKLVVASIEPASVDDSIYEMPPQTANAIAAGDSVQIPFELVSNDIIIQAKANDQRLLSLVVDTGATQSILDKTVAATLGQCTETKFEMTTGSGTVPLSYLILPKLQLGKIVFKNLPFAVTDLSPLTQIIGRHPSGLLGANVLRRFLVTVDYEHKVLTLADPATVQIKPHTIVIPAKPTLGLFGLLVDGTLDGKQISFLVDTGAAFNNMSEKLAKPILSCPLLPVGTVQGLDGRKIPIGSVQFNSLKMASLTVRHPIFSIAPPGSNPIGLIAGAGIAILGNPFWSKFCLTVDYQNQRILLDRSKEQIKTDELFDRISTLEKEALTQPRSKNFKSAYESLRRQAVSEHATGAEAVCLAHLVALNNVRKPDATSNARLLRDDEKERYSALFKEAERKAKSSLNSSAYGKVMAIAASYYCDNFSQPNAVAFAKPLLTTAAVECAAEPSIYVATAKLLKKTKTERMLSQIVDQALMLDPSNWEALWLKYELADQSNDHKLKNLVIEQLNQYYKDVPAVKRLTTK
jgi:predicted aspartyl protease